MPTHQAMENAALPYDLTVRAIIEDEAGRLLLVRRSPQSIHFAGEWEFPGGKLDPGENVDAAIRREVREETGLEIGLDRVAGVTEFQMPRVRVVVLCFYAHRTGGDVRLSSEHDRFVWASPDAMEQLPLTHVPRDVRNFLTRR